jgi:polyferredoxin
MADRAGLARILLAKPHRFRRRRAATACLSIVLTALVPLAGMARLDLASGRHLALFDRTSAPRAVAAIVLSVFLFYLVTFLVNAVGGRLFCGWGCPLAYATRLTEAVAASRANEGRRGRARLARAAYTTALAAALTLWFADPRAVATGRGAAAAAVVFGAALGAVRLHARFWGWAFCRGFCPIGLYYTVVAPAKSFGLRFDRAAGTCIACGACDAVCPVAIAPRELERPVERVAGLAPSGAPGFNHCLSCGDCIEACEHATRKSRTRLAGPDGKVPPAPLGFAWWPLANKEEERGL